MRSRFTIDDQTGVAQCANVIINPTGGDPPLSVMVATSTTGAHIFYTLNNSTPIIPTHSGDNATGSTIRIGSNSSAISISGSVNHTRELACLAYESGLADSGVTYGSYNALAPLNGGGGG